MRFRFWNFVLFFSLVKFCVLFILVGISSHLLEPDSNEYIFLAREIFENPVSLFKWSEMSNNRMPGYPLLLAVGFYFFGDWIYGAAIMQVLFFQFVSLAFAVVIRRVYSDFEAKIFWAAVTLGPMLMVYQGLVLADILFSAVVCLGYLFLYTAIIKRDVVLVFCGISVISISIFIKPISVLLPLTISFGFLLLWLKNRSSRFVLHACLVCCVSSLVVIILVEHWSNQNLYWSGMRVFSYVSIVNLHEGLSAAIHARGTSQPWSVVSEQFAVALQGVDGAVISAYVFEKFIEQVGLFPLAAFEVFIKGLMLNIVDSGIFDVMRAWGLRDEIGFARQLNDLGVIGFIEMLLLDKPFLLLSAILGCVLQLVIFGLFLVGALTGVTSPAVRLLTLMFVFYFLMIAAGPFAMARFKLPVDLIIYFFAAVYLGRLLTLRRAASN